jgi:hypothetical protein
MERIISDQLLVYLQENNLLSPQQYGFQKKCSTIMQLLDCYNDWSAAQNNGQSVDIIYLDYAKAFDSVVHAKLLIKLKAYGISDNLLAWIEQFLMDRTHYVSIDNVHSHLQHVLSGVPQGTVLGPLLFIIYVNDMPSVVVSGVVLKLFADDSKIYKAISSVKDCILLQASLHHIVNWSFLWQLSINIDKSLVLHVGNANPHFVYEINGISLQAPDFVVDLGITMSKHLTFHEHVKHLLAKCYQKLFIIKKCFEISNRDILHMLYTSYIRPILEYGTLIWAPHSDSEINQLEKFQRKVLSLHGNSITLESLESRRIKSDLCYYYAILHNYAKLDPNKFFVLNRRPNHRGHSFLLTTPITRTAAFKYAFSQRRIQLWNSLPNKVVCSSSISRFKSLLHTLY